MKNILKLACAFMICLFAVSAASAQVNSDYDKDFDFSGVKTYKFLGWSDNSDKAIRESDVEAIQSAMKAELDARGLKLVTGDADLDVSFFATVNERESKSAYTDYTGSYGYYGMRWGWGRGYWAGPGAGMSSYTSIDTDYYTEGTFVVDFFDTSDKKLVYEGLIKIEVNDNAQKRVKKTPKKVKKIMKKFPVKKQK